MGPPRAFDPLLVRPRSHGSDTHELGTHETTTQVEDRRAHLAGDLSFHHAPVLLLRQAVTAHPIAAAHPGCHLDPGAAHGLHPAARHAEALQELAERMIVASNDRLLLRDIEQRLSLIHISEPTRPY